MSQENVEVVKALYEVWNGPDGGENAIAFLSDDFEWVNPDYAVEPGTRHGHAGWSQAMDSLDAAFPHREHELGRDERPRDGVLAFTTFVARTSAGTISFRQDEPHLWTLHNGKVVRLEWFHDRSEAIEAARG